MRQLKVEKEELLGRNSMLESLLKVQQQHHRDSQGAGRLDAKQVPNPPLPPSLRPSLAPTCLPRRSAPLHAPPVCAYPKDTHDNATHAMSTCVYLVYQ